MKNRVGFNAMAVALWVQIASIGLVTGTAITGTAVAADPVQAEPMVGSPFAKQLQRIDLDDFRGRRWKLDDFAQNSYLVVAFLGTECPLAKLYAARLQAMQDEFNQPASGVPADGSAAAAGVQVIGVMSNRHDSLLDIQSFAHRQQLSFPILKDAGGRLADDLAAERTPEVFVFDSERRLQYRGRIDDQYGIGYVRDEPRRRDLRTALDELQSGKPVSVPKTEAVGCIIGRKKAVSTEAHVTYGGQVADILNRHCVQCHRQGEIAPFELTQFDEVAGWADMIAEVVREQRMPPWHADPSHGDFANARRMTEQEKQTLYDWADAGAPAGDLSELPELPEHVAGWQLPREPDLVFDVSPQPIDVPATGAVRYQYYSVDTKLDKDVWIQAAQLKPGNRSVVHHILAFAVPKGQRNGINGARGFLVGYVPGARVQPWPTGHAQRVPAGSELIFQVHYTPIGTATTDHSQLGICLVDESTVTHEIVTTSAVQTRFSIPPGEANHRVAASSPDFPADAKLLSMSPHMHVRGKAFEYQLASTNKVLLSIPQYDFNWQTTYVLDEPLPVESGDRIVCHAVFDNSADNLNNPDPDATVKWGDQTWDEMMIGYYHLSVPRSDADQASGETAAARRQRLMQQAVRLATFDRIDKDGDGKITREQTPRRFHSVFDELDANDDGTLTRTEAESQ
ncbi:redoxin domain-containing protein [Stieleria sp. TO1_6]|uniref:redoxin domain-containing protein n=1 Tax=Stieleria tagensis TaxID=2956795 RepID=UPI00209AF079|nr:redoxin domain-containing protein [Stieleria tagensis]MCO8121886.1 redoxin domain-containing protein [Stieleria tagensis]